MSRTETRTCVFAGGTGLIGRGAVLALARKGIQVVMLTHNASNAEQIMQMAEGMPGKVVALKDTRDYDDIFKRVYELMGSVDIVINSTGGLLAPVEPEQITDDLLDRQLHQLVTGTYSMIRAALPYLKKSGEGRIILVASGGALSGLEEENIADSVARGALVSMTYALSGKLIREGITVNCIARSGMIDDHPQVREGFYRADSMEGKVPAGALGTADEFGSLAAYIADASTRFITGHVFNLTGGLVVQ